MTTIKHLPTSWTDEWLDSGARVWRDIDPRPACGSTEGQSITDPDDCEAVDCPACKPYVWDCGCIAHHTKPGGMGVFCITEDNGYCNFECPHDEEDYEERKAELIEAGVEKSEAIEQAEREVNDRREASIAVRRGQARECRHCGRAVAQVNGAWLDPEATGDDSLWRETCADNHEDRIAAHEPKED